MAVITGYARRPEKRWPIILLIIIAALLGLMLLVIFYPTTGKTPEKKRPAPKVKTIKLPTLEAKAVEKSKPLPAGSETAVEKIVFTSKIGASNLPMDNLSKFSVGENGRVYCYTRVMAKDIPQTIRHVWIAPGGEVAADIQLNIHNQPADTWSYVNVAGIETGNWEVQVQKENGDLLARGYFSSF
jgi:hypothetical protein